jgi:hypothetical protein
MGRVGHYLQVVRPKTLKLPEGQLKIEFIEERDGCLWVLASSEDFPTDPDGYWFSNPPLKHSGQENTQRVFDQILTEAVQFYADHPEVHGQATLTAYSDTSDGEIRSQDSTYASARSGAFLVANSTHTGEEGGANAGQYLIGDYYCYQGFYAFDTSSIGTGTVTAVVFSLYGFYDGSATDFTIECRLKDWGASLDTADFVDGASLSGLTLLATFATSGFSAAGYNAFTDVAFPANVNTGGTTRVMIASDRQRTNTAPAGEERVVTYFSDFTGSTNDPKLVVTYTPVSAAPSVMGWIR